MIRLENVTKVYDGGVVALKDVTVDIAKGEFVFLVGPSGSGKSTVIRLMMREEAPSNGDIWVAGKHASNLPNWKVPHLRRSIGTVFQDFKLLPNKTVYENVAFAMEVTGKARSVIRTQVPQVLKLVGLSTKADRNPRQLSGGEQQRVSVARAFVNRPLILLADEPTGNLDPATSVGIMRILDRINRTGTTVVMATHDHAIVDAMRRRVVQLDRGRVVRDESRGVYETSVRSTRPEPAPAPAAAASERLSLRRRRCRGFCRRGGLGRRCRRCRRGSRGGCRRRDHRGGPRGHRTRGRDVTRLRYVAREAFQNIGRNALVVLGAILAVFISLTLTFGTVVFGEVVRINTLQWAEDVRVIAFIQDDVAPVAIADLQAEIKTWEEVDDVFFVTKSEALEEAQVLLANQPASLRVLNEQPDIIPASLRVQPTEPDDYQTIVIRLEGTPGLRDVQSAGPAIEAMIALRDGLRIMFWLLALALGVAAVALIANTIHMAIYARREEIEIMRLVGASNWFLRTPFIVEGAVEGLIGGVLAVAFIVVVQKMAVDRLTELPQWINVAVNNDFLMQRGALVLLFGVLAGLVGSSLSLAVHRHLRA